MAKDRISLFIPNLPEAILKADGDTWNARNYRGKWHTNKSSESDHRSMKYLYGSLSCKAGYIDVQFLKFSSEYGDLLLSLSVAEIFNFTNAIPKSVVSGLELAQKILSDLKYVLDISKLPNYEEWVISKDETCVDVIDTQENIMRRLKILSKTNMPYRNVDTEYLSKHTVYFRARAGKKSASQVVVYDKVREQRERKGLNMSNLLNLSLSEGCMRIELKTRSATLRRNLKLVRKATGQYMASRFSLFLSHEYQEYLLYEVIVKLNLDKAITTRANLIMKMKESGLFTIRQLNTAIEVMKYENGEECDQIYSSRTISKYKKQIMSTGYNILYSDVELKPITIELLSLAIANDTHQIYLVLANFK